MEEFNDMPRETQLFYIASELYEAEKPCVPPAVRL
jgi:hypothetical protein|nr:MAG TPA: hypothetical protein [Caudoviricetes sp.]